MSDTHFGQKVDPNHPHGPNMVIDSLEYKEIERRWPIALRELSSVLQRIRDIGRANPEHLHRKISKVEKKRLTDALMKSFLKDERPELKRSVARRMADKIGNYLLWRRESSIPVIHELIVLLPWWISHIPGDVIPKLRDIGLNYILNGRVVPVQMAWEDILYADPVYLGHCACRSAGVVDDLSQDGKVFNLLSKEDDKRLMDRMMDRYRELIGRHGSLPDTHSRYAKLFQELDELRKKNSSEYCVNTFLKQTYPDWEILPVLHKYTPSWIRSMHKNRKAKLIHKELVFDMATILYLSRGTIFSSMKLFDTPYTICSCPTPETGGGCTLTNWYYWGLSNSSLMPNEEFNGRRTDESGKIRACKYVPVRSKRQCLGCGCDHGRDDSRNVDFILKQADEMFAEYKRRQRVAFS
jgi:hypothetical protein